MSIIYPIVDAFCTPGPFSTRQPDQPYTPQEMLAAHAKFGIGRRLCLHAESRDGVPLEGNTAMDRIAAENPGTGVIWTALPPKRLRSEPTDRLMERAKANGVAGFALFPRKQLHYLEPWANGELYAAMAEARLPLILEGVASDFPAIYEIAKSYKRIPVVIWNASYRSDRFLVPIMDECKNVHVGLGAGFIQTGCIEDFAERYGPGRLIYGSGWPAQEPGQLISFVTYADVDEKAKRAILSGNIERIVGDIRWPVKGFEGGK